MNKNILLSIIIIFSLISITFFSGCINKEHDSVYGTIGKKEVFGSINNVVINEYSLYTKIFNESSNSFDVIEGSVESENVVLYTIEGTATNTGDEKLAMVNISVRLFRELSKAQYYIGEKYYLKYAVNSGETWKFSIELPDGDNKFGPIDNLRFNIITEK